MAKEWSKTKIRYIFKNITVLNVAAGIREEHSARRQLEQGYIPNKQNFNGDPEVICEDFIKGKKGVNGMCIV